MIILVTGGTSTVGKHLQEVLPHATYLSSKDVDLTDTQKTIDFFKQFKPDVVIHLAALVGGIQDNLTRPVDYLSDNLYINTNTIKATYESGCTRLIALSSTCAYPDKVENYPMTEDDLFNGPPAISNFGYAYSKRCMAELIHSYNAQYDTKYCYITPSNLYSELDTHTGTKAHYVTALVEKIKISEELNCKHIDLLGTGKPLRQFTHAGDIADLIDIMIHRDIYQSFNASNPEVYSIDELANLTLKAFNKSDWTTLYYYPQFDGQFRKDVSIDKLMKYIPDFSFTKFADGIKKVYNNTK